jgi:hypothetical protein
METRLSIDKKSLTVLELRRLLIELREERPDICIRYRLIGQTWTRNFARIVHVVDSIVFVKEEESSVIFPIPSLGNIVQFEIDNNFHSLKAYFHYDVVLDQEQQALA